MRRYIIFHNFIRKISQLPFHLKAQELTTLPQKTDHRGMNSLTSRILAAVISKFELTRENLQRDEGAAGGLVEYMAENT